MLLLSLLLLYGGVACLAQNVANGMMIMQYPLSNIHSASDDGFAKFAFVFYIYIYIRQHLSYNHIYISAAHM